MEVLKSDAQHNEGKPTFTSTSPLLAFLLSIRVPQFGWGKVA